jgi:hypothetical protein
MTRKVGEFYLKENCVNSAKQPKFLSVDGVLLVSTSRANTVNIHVQYTVHFSTRAYINKLKQLSTFMHSTKSREKGAASGRVHQTN